MSETVRHSNRSCESWRKTHREDGKCFNDIKEKELGDIEKENVGHQTIRHR